MKAILCNAFGTPSELVYEDIPSPKLGKGEVRVGIHAAGVYYGDALLIAGGYQLKPPFPFVPGTEAAGEVLEVGEGVDGLKPGDRVMGGKWYGCFAEEMIVSLERVFKIPENMDYQDAAAFHINYGTAHLALTHRGNLKAGEVLLVHGAAGGVGLTTVELGKQLGATVIATASTPEKLALVEKYGADHLINYTEENFKDKVKELTGGNGADVIFDPVGGDVFDQSMRCINWEGRILVIGFTSGRIPEAPTNLTLVKNFSIVGVFWGAYIERDNKTYRASLETLLKMYSEGKLNPHIMKTYPLEKAGDALDVLLNRQATGKIVLTVK